MNVNYILYVELHNKNGMWTKIKNNPAKLVKVLAKRLSTAPANLV